jgi:hypothetical protein
MHDLLILKGFECKTLLMLDLLIHLDIFILILHESIVGGVIFEEQEKIMFDGELIILWSQMNLKID